MKKILLFIFFLLPFLWAFSFLKADRINYSAYYSIIILIFALLNVLLDPKLKLDKYLYFWFWFLFMLLIAWPIAFVLKNYGYLTYPFTAVSLYIILKYYCSTEDYFFFLKLFLFAASIQALISISQSFFGFPIFENITTEIFESNRNYLAYLFPSLGELVRQGTGTFEQFNGLGSYLALSLPIAYGYWKATHSKKKLILMSIIALGLISTFSRGSLIGALLGLYYIFFLSTKRKLRFFILTVTLSVIILFFLSSAIVSYYQATQNFTIREYTWVFAFNKALTQPVKLLYGFGPFYFKEKLLGLYGTITNLHSGQIQILLELGVIGFTLFMSLFIDVIKVASKYKNNFAVVSITGGLIAFFISQLFDNAFFGYNGILWFSLLAIIFKIRENNIFIIKNK